jgi:hypothetical protein
MSFPSDVTLPANAKYIAFVDEKKSYNPNYDIIWSFQYAISGSSIKECAFATFLTISTPSVSAIPGHYLGYGGNVPLSAFLLDENGDYILSEDNERIILEGNGENDGLIGLCIAFDTTGLFALSSLYRPGVGLNNIKRNSLIIRDINDNITLYEELSNIDPAFTILSSSKVYKTLRFKYTNTDKLTIDYKIDGSNTFVELTSVNINSNPDSISFLRPGFSYSSPVSSTSNVRTAPLYLKNFHVQGTENLTTVETAPFERF